ncbi:MAG: class I SAM-dependent methyltransferase [Actinomycetota bacterium]|nr:class I SAM-dependent methyltransferase [Actinomycetota bacterium]
MAVPVGSAFEDLAARYDAWYDMASGRKLFDLELRCLRPLLSGTGPPRLEVGVGSGRFATALGIEVGLDPARAPLDLAARRGVRVVQGAGEQLPFADHGFNVVILVVTLCFADDPAGLLDEVRRVLRPGGSLVVGLVPGDSAWGQAYEEKRRAGHPFYQGAHFLTLADHLGLLGRAGFEVVAARSTLRQAPMDAPVDEEVREGALSEAGFVAVAAGTRWRGGRDEQTTRATR